VSSQLTISAGMPRAGSGWYYNLVHDLVFASGGKNAREIREQYYLRNFLTEVNCNVSTLKIQRLLPVFIPTVFGNSFAVKTHAGPTGFSSWLQSRGRLRVIYIYRDPRAALLSAYEYGQKGLKQKRDNAFQQIKTLDDAGEFMQFYVTIWQAWSEDERVLLVRYEDLISDYTAEFNRLVDHLRLDIEQQIAYQVLERYSPEKGEPGQKGTHFSEGQAERFRKIFSPTQLKQFTRMFEPVLSSMGYAL